jgi:glycosyltransferase involved in cell wall biosynthesis
MNPAPINQGRRLDPEADESARAGNPEFAASDVSRLSVSVIIPAFTIDRWPLIVKAVESVRTQSVAPEEIVVCIDHDDKLLERARAEWSRAGAPPVRVIANRFSNRGGGSTRNCAVETVTSDIAAFLDDDAWAEPDWLERLLSVYEEFPVVAVGGPPLPDYETRRPAWFPSSFDWVFGCAYEGLPKSTGPLRHLFGGNMAVRRGSFMTLNGFQSVDFDTSSKPAAARTPLDDVDLCMRLAYRFGADSLYYEPRAVVHHYVPAERLSWRYFYRRCYFVSRRKAQTLR